MGDWFPILLFHGASTLIAGAVLRDVARSGETAFGRHGLPWTVTRVLVVLPAVHLLLAVLLGGRFGINLFFAVQLLAHGVFIQMPGALLGLGWLARRRGARRMVRAANVGTFGVVAIAVYAFAVEPFRLEVNHHVIESQALDERLRIVLVADLQTDGVGAYERRALEAVADAGPDLVLFAGDYLHVEAGPERERQIAMLNGLLRELGIDGELGAVAVPGNCDGFDWPRVFDGTPIRPVRSSDRIELGPVTVTALDVRASNASPSRGNRSIPGAEGFHIVLGHHPDFALGDVDADLLLAGHCHGGQVRFPFFGPPITLSRIPRRWTSGLHEIRPGQHLCVSRGIGMERGQAPPMRFLCRPEVVVIDVVPASRD